MDMTKTTAPATYADPHPGKRGDALVTEDCSKCSGRGRIEAFAGIDNGRCWHCMGAKTIVNKVSAIRARVRRQVRADEAAQVRAVENRAAAADAADALEGAIAAMTAIFPRIAEDLADTSLYFRDNIFAYARQIGADCTPAQAVARYRFHLGEIVEKVLPNRYFGRCDLVPCRAKVPAGAGWTGRKAIGWVTYCAEHKPESLL